MRKFIYSIAVLLILSPMVTSAETNAPASQPNPLVIMETTLGEIQIELFSKEAPVSVKNFLQYVESSFYNGLIFHRVITNFMIQGGGFEPGMKLKRPTSPPITNEAKNGLSNSRGTLAMARTPDIDSATSQFFINLIDNTFLNHRGDFPPDRFGYAVFGKVIKGMDVVDKIAKTSTGTNGRYQDVPKQDIMIIKGYVK